MIRPDEIPRIAADLDVVTLSGRSLITTGKDFADTGADVHGAWQGMAASYRAPEADTLLTATVPVRTKAAAVGADLQAVGQALVTYAEAVRPLQARLSTLWAKAWAFRDEVDGHDDWNEDRHLVAEHNQLLTDVNAAHAAFEAAERACANAIDARFGGTDWIADNGDGIHAYNEFGFTADLYDSDAAEGVLLWGKIAEHDLIWWKDGWNDYMRLRASFWHGAADEGRSILDLFGRSGSEQAEQGWTGIYEIALLVAPPLWIGRGFGLGPHLDDPLADYKNMAKGLLAWDEWRKDPAKAAGTVTWNALSILLPGKGAAITVKALRAARAAEGAQEGVDAATATAGANDSVPLAGTTEVAVPAPASDPSVPQLDTAIAPTLEPPASIRGTDPRFGSTDFSPHPTEAHSDGGGHHAHSAGNGHEPAGDGSDAPSHTAEEPDAPSLSGTGGDPGPAHAPISSSSQALGPLVKVRNPDPSADLLAERLHGEARVKFAHDPKEREFDAVSDRYVAQAKPADFALGQKFRRQAKATFEFAKATGRQPYFQFDGPPDPDVLRKLQEYSDRYDLPMVLDFKPLREQ